MKARQIAEPGSAAAQAVDAAELYEGQIRYLYRHSAFYRDKLSRAGFGRPESVGGLADISNLPFTEKDALRASKTHDNPIGAHLAATMDELVRIYSTSGTTGSPSYIPLTKRDLEDWVTISSRSYGASGVKRGERIVSTYNAGPFVAGATQDAFSHLSLCQIPVGAGNTERLMAAVQLLRPEIVALTPSYAQYLIEWAQKRNIDLAGSSVSKVLVAGEPGGSEPELRKRLQTGWGAKVTEAMGIGDIAISLWGECEFQDGMHFNGYGLVHFELVDPESGEPVTLQDGAMGELVYTHLRQQAAPLLRFRSRDHAVIKTSACQCGRTGPRIRCIGRTDDMLIVRGVNLFPTAVREVVASFKPQVSGMISIRPEKPGVKQSPPLPVAVEIADGFDANASLADAIKRQIRDMLMVTTDVRLVEFGSLPRSDYKSKLVEWPEK